MKAIDTTLAASITSAVTLTASEKKEIEDVISGINTDALIAFSYHVDRDVLGGVKVEVGDLVLDTTIASQLKKVKNILVK